MTMHKMNYSDSITSNHWSHDMSISPYAVGGCAYSYLICTQNMCFPFHVDYIASVQAFAFI